LIWIVTFGFSLSYWIFTGAIEHDRSDPHPTSKWPSCAISIDV